MGSAAPQAAQDDFDGFDDLFSIDETAYGSDATTASPIVITR